MRETISYLLESVNYKIKEFDYTKSDYFYYYLPSSGKYAYVKWSELEKVRSDIRDYTQSRIFEKCEEILNKRGVKTKKWGKLLTLVHELDNCKAPSQSEIDRFVEAITALHATQDTTFELIDDVMNAYKNTNLKSCMANEEYINTALYQYMPVKYLSQRNAAGEEISRSLLWSGVKDLTNNKEILLCDRIYSENTAAYASHVLYAEKLGAVIRHAQDCYSYKTFKIEKAFTSEAVELELEITADLETIKSVRWPYLDTFRYYFEEDNKAVFRNFDKDWDGWGVDKTDGTNYYKSFRTCDFCHAEVEDLVAVRTGDQLCRDCLGEYEYCYDIEELVPRDECYYCETDERHYYRDTDLIRVGDRYYLSEDANIIYCYHSEQYILSVDSVYCIDIDEHVHSDYAYFCESDDNFYYYDSKLSKRGDKYYLAESEIEA